jgi:hypothetical protein
MKVTFGLHANYFRFTSWAKQKLYYLIRQVLGMVAVCGYLNNYTIHRNHKNAYA